MVEVVDEQVEGLDPLLEAGLDLAPFVVRNDPRHDVEGKDPFGPLFVTVDTEGDPHLQQGLLGRLLAALQLLERQGR